MSVELNHTIVNARDKQASASFVTRILGLGDPAPFGPFLAVKTANGVTLDYRDADGDITSQHYAFLVSEDEFDQILNRIKQADLEFWADPAHRRAGEINTNDGGRGLYFDDPDGHNMEIITRPYGSGG